MCKLCPQYSVKDVVGTYQIATNNCFNLSTLLSRNLLSGFARQVSRQCTRCRLSKCQLDAFGAAEEIKISIKKIEFYSYVKDDYIDTALIINYDPLNNHIKSATLQSNSYGVIKYENNKYEVHVWEDEDHVREISEVSKRYTTILLNGLTTDNQRKI